MRCQFCHNADTWSRAAGQPKTADEVLEKALRCRPYWGKEGGITVSGGEAMLQIPFVTELFKKCHAEGINTCLDTSGQPFTFEEPMFSQIKEMLSVTDLVMLDITMPEMDGIQALKKIKESEDLREMRESIEEMERELKSMDQDIAEANDIPDPEMREVAVKNLEQMRESTREMIASFKETYKVMLESEAKMSELMKEVK